MILLSNLLSALETTGNLDFATETYTMIVVQAEVVEGAVPRGLECAAPSGGAAGGGPSPTILTLTPEQPER